MLRRSDPASVTLWFEGKPVRASPGDSVAAALLASGILVTRQSALSGASRGPYCMMGVCFDCLAVVDERSGVQTCLTPVREGMKVKRQNGANAPL
ncbi:MAG: (2Fe-2S)-binding protein [Acetobacteraceae bacterium]